MIQAVDDAVLGTSGCTARPYHFNSVQVIGFADGTYTTDAVGTVGSGGCGLLNGVFDFEEV